jgi:hypothetical protein
MAIDIDELFTQLGKIFNDQESVNTFRLSTTTISDIFTQFDGTSTNVRRALANFQNADIARQNSLSASMQSSRVVAQQLVIETVADDVALSRKTLEVALAELIRQMITASDTVDESTTSASVGSISGSSNPNVVACMIDERGKSLQYCLDEAIRVECTASSSLAATSFALTGEIAVTDQLSQAWPGGSGINRTIIASTPATSLLLNSGFDDEDDLANAPDDWYISVGTVGTTIKMTDYEVQTIAISGSPSSGVYRISWANAAGKVQVTETLAYNADGTAVQDALNLLVGLETVTVTTTGTTPNFTHTITFTGIAGNVAQFTIVGNTTGGTITPGTTTTGSTNAFSGKAVELDSDGSQLTTLNQAVTLSPLTRYAFSIRMLADVVPAAGVITFDLVDGIGGSVVADESSTNISSTVTCSGLTTSFAARSFSFTTPQTLPPITYFRIRISTAVSAGTSIYIDHACLTAMTELYAGGPCVAIFNGNILPEAKNGTSDGDYLTLTIANDYAGEFQSYFERNFQMAAKRLRLPSNSGGTETLADSLIG